MNFSIAGRCDRINIRRAVRHDNVVDTETSQVYTNRVSREKGESQCSSALNDREKRIEVGSRVPSSQSIAEQTPETDLSYL